MSECPHLASLGRDFCIDFDSLAAKKTLADANVPPTPPEKPGHEHECSDRARPAADAGRVADDDDMGGREAGRSGA
jgi:hypothetical protein